MLQVLIKSFKLHNYFGISLSHANRHMCIYNYKYVNYYYQNISHKIEKVLQFCIIWIHLIFHSFNYYFFIFFKWIQSFSQVSPLIFSRNLKWIRRKFILRKMVVMDWILFKENNGFLSYYNYYLNFYKLIMKSFNDWQQNIFLKRKAMKRI